MEKLNEDIEMANKAMEFVEQMVPRFCALGLTKKAATKRAFKFLGGLDLDDNEFEPVSK